MATTKPKLKINITKLVLLLIIAALLLVALGLGVYALIGDKKQVITSQKLPIDARTDLVIGKGRVSYTTDTELVEYLLDGSGVQRSALGAAVDGYAVSGKTAVVYLDSMVQIRGMSPLQMTGDVRGVRCYDSYVAILRTGASGSDSVIVVDTQTGESQDALNFAKNTVTGFGFITEGETIYMWVAATSVEQSTPVCTLQLYDVGNNGALLYFPVFYDQLIEKLYITDNSIFIVGTQDIVRYELGGSRESYRVRIYGNSVVDMTIKDKMAYFLLMPENQSSNSTIRLMMISEGDTSGESTMTIHINEEIVGAFLQEGVIRILSANYLYSYSYKGKAQFTIETDVSCIAAFKVDDSRIIITSENACYICKVEEKVAW